MFGEIKLYISMALSCILCEIEQVIGGKSQKFYNPPVFSASAGGGDPSEFHKKMFNTVTTRMIGLLCGEETVTIC